MAEAIDAEERELKLDQMRADIQNKRMDTEYKRGLLRWEPWKVMVAALAATAALFGVLGGLAGYRFGAIQSAPQTIVIQIPATLPQMVTPAPPGGSK
jgi:negative regulator of sigma E activity